jgi:hydroxymethylglutaryl-CoA lyase
MSNIKLIECPRDAMQGITHFIDTDYKVEYLNALLKAGFHTLDFGSFVSPQAIPQMKDTREVIPKLDLDNTRTKLLAIVANLRGAEDAVAYPEIDYLGYPFSLSETFQQRNTKRSRADSLELITEMQDLCMRNRKELVVYLSMGFGNPYGDNWSADLVLDFAHTISKMGVGIISLADTVGSAEPAIIRSVYEALIPQLPEVEIGAHFHATPSTWEGKIAAAYEAGCRRFDGALKGYGGCPFAKDELTGNVATENIIHFLEQNGERTGIDLEHFTIAMKMAGWVLGGSKE